MMRIILLLLSLLSLSACEPSVEDYVEDAKARDAKLKECADMGMSAAKEDVLCQRAFEAQKIAIKNATNNLLNTITMQNDE
jgi:hypothetical protein